jgi:hypothetical protein
MLSIVSSLEMEVFQKEFTKALTAARDQKIIKEMFLKTYLLYQKK